MDNQNTTRHPQAGAGFRHHGRCVVMCLVLATRLLASVACAAESTNQLAWPAPPAQAAIVYSREITGPADIGVKPSAFIRMANWITGTSKTKAHLEKPFGLSLDAKGNLLVTDMGDNSVTYLDFAKKKWSRWASAGKTRFASPVAAVKYGDSFLVADSALAKVIAFDEKGKIRYEIAGEFERPAGMALSGERLYIADAARHQVVICDVRGKLIAKFGKRGKGAGEFNYPTHVSVDGAGRVYVTDSLNNRIQVFDNDGKFLREFGGAGDGPGRFNRPKGVAVDREEHVYVVDAMFGNVQIFDGAGRLLLDWGGAGAQAGEFWLPNAITITPTDEIFVADTYNHRIQVFRYTGRHE